MSALSDYLDYYKQLNAPGYAVLVTGAWGVGKSFQVIAALGEGNVYKVSLFGLSTAAEIHEAVLAVVAPMKTSIRKLARTGREGGMVGGPEGLAAFMISGLAGAAVRLSMEKDFDQDRVLVFDDLERCSLGLKQTLGVINNFVEHHRCKVVVIAHDKKMVSRFRRVKEKIFGQYIECTPEVDDAFDSFANALDDPDAQRFVQEFKPKIIEIFNLSSAFSLRVLKQVVMDVGRFRATLAAKHLGHEALKADLFALFIALNIEVRMGRLEPRDIQGRADPIRDLANAIGDRPRTPLELAQDRYPNVGLANMAISDHVLIEMLFQGRFDATSIQTALDQSEYFIEARHSQPWEYLYSFRRFNEEVLDAKFLELQQQFDRREITDIGPLFHVFCMRLFWAQHGLLAWSIEEEFRRCSSYIDDLVRDLRLDGEPRVEHLDGGSYGREFVVSDATRDHVVRLRDRLASEQAAIRNRELHFRTGEIIQAMYGEGDISLTDLMIMKGELSGGFSDIPILTHMPADEFLQSWLDAPAAEWSNIVEVFTSRWRHGKLEAQLFDERNWIVELAGLVRRELDSRGGFTRLKLSLSANALFEVERQVQMLIARDRIDGERGQH